MKHLFFNVFASVVLCLVIIGTAHASESSLAQRLHGYILLQVEDHGEAWYVRSDENRYYMQSGSVAYSMMRYFSIGITNVDLSKIPSVDTTNEMLTASSICDSNTLATRLSGEILLQVEQHGEAWYVYPKTCRRIYLKDGDAAYSIMRFLGLGITNTDLDRIPMGEESQNTIPTSSTPTEQTLPETKPEQDEPPLRAELALAEEDPGEQIIGGRYADPDVIQLSDGTWKMFFGVEPEVEGTEFEVFSATSTDGESWELDGIELLTFSTFPDVIELDNGHLRMYVQKAGEIYSALSTDGGATFNLEYGARISENGDRDSDGVAAPTVLRLNDSTYLMVFRAAQAGAFQPTSINQITTTFFLARSNDGRTWERGDVIVDSRQDPYDGYIDGPELFYNNEAQIELRFWTSGVSDDPQTSGHYRMTSSDGESWSDPEQFSTIMGGDPTYAYLDDGTLAMYYTIHTDGVYLKTDL
jgi:hypothetical protein